MRDSGPTAGVTGKGGNWREKPPDAESAVWGRFPESAGSRPHLSGARGVRLGLAIYITRPYQHTAEDFVQRD